MKTRYLPLLLLGFMLCACEEYFDLNTSSNKPRLFVECYLGASDTTSLKILKTTPVGKKASSSLDYHLKSLSLRENGVEIPLQKAADGSLWTNHTFAQGSSISLTAEAEGLPAIKAESRIPDKPSFCVKCERKTQLSQITEEYIQFDVTLDSPALEDEYYGAVVRKKVVTDHGDSLCYVEPISLNLDAGLMEALQTALKVAYFDGEQLMIFKGSDISRAGNTISFGVEDYSYLDDWFNDYTEEEDVEEEDKEPEDVRYQVALFRLSSECYGYMNAKYNQENNILSMLGMCPPDYAYTNISEGYGVFAGISATQSEWVKEP